MTDALTTAEADALLADPAVIGPEAAWDYYWENGHGYGEEPDPSAAAAAEPDPAEEHHRWLSGMGDAQLDERLSECPGDAAAVDRVRAERAERWRAWQDEDVYAL